MSQEVEILVSHSSMVYYFTSKVVDPAAFIYVGKDKFESTTVNLFLLR